MRAFAMVLAWCPAAAASPARADAARAQRLFDEAVVLKQRGRYREACPKLVESQRLDPGLGTQYHLADCYDKSGRTASAWSLFQEIAKQAAVSGQIERERVARERVDEIAARVPRLLIAVPVTSDVAGLAIVRDGELLPRASWNTALPVDPGAHEIVARTAARTWQASVTLDARARTESVVVPDLGLHEAQRVAVSESAPEDRSSDGRRIAGVAALGAGVVGLGAGAFLLVGTTNEDAAAERSTNGLAVAACAVGAVASAAGVYLIVSKPKGTAPRAYASATGLGVRIGGSF